MSGQGGMRQDEEGTYSRHILMDKQQVKPTNIVSYCLRCGMAAIGRPNELELHYTQNRSVERVEEYNRKRVGFWNGKLHWN